MEDKKSKKKGFAGADDGEVCFHDVSYAGLMAHRSHICTINTRESTVKCGPREAGREGIKKTKRKDLIREESTSA